MSQPSDPTNSLTSWNDGAARQAIIEFVARVTREGSADYLPPSERIAVFDNDGTLWCEKPMYIQLDFALRKLAAQAEADATLRQRQPWKAAYEHDFAWFGELVTRHYQGDDSDLHLALQGLLQLSHDQPVEQIEQEALAFVQSTAHPTLGLPYFECIYRPMVELLALLAANAFTNYIVSGGGRDFMRGIAEPLYGVPRERIIGSTVAYRYVDDNGGAILQKAELDMIDDGPGKPIQIWNVVARRPILAAGNSNGDLQMLRFTGGGLPALRLLVLHDDAGREFDYVAGAEQILDEARRRDWTIVSMRDDWAGVFTGGNVGGAGQHG